MFILCSHYIYHPIQSQEPLPPPVPPPVGGRPGVGPGLSAVTPCGACPPTGVRAKRRALGRCSGRGAWVTMMGQRGRYRLRWWYRKPYCVGGLWRESLLAKTLPRRR